MSSDSDPALNATLAQAPAGTTATVASSMPSLAGSSMRLTLPDYEVGPLLGRGGMGEIVVGHDRSIGRDVAIKQLRMEQPTPDAIARFLREARIQARLEHPAIVPVHQIGHDENGLPYFTMKKLVGTTLAEQLASPEVPARQRLLRCFTEVCQAVEFAHARGVVHRDLKPANIMLGDFGAVYVLDWGLARITGEREARSVGDAVPSLDGVTQAGAMLGTPGYMAPEQIEDASAVGPAADVYALGAILYEILAGEAVHPRTRGALVTTLQGVEQGPAQRRPERQVPPELDELCLAALATDPAARPSVQELAARMQGFLDGDRDVERRRELAASYVRAAHEALASGDLGRRIEALQAAGRALALDPESAEAGALVTRLMFDPTREYPAELREKLSATEVTVQRRQGKAALLSFVVVLAYLAIAASNGVRDLPLVLAIAGYTVLHGSLVWRITRRAASPGEMLVVAAGNAILAALLSRTLGSMIIVPAVTCLMALSLTSYPQLIDRRWIVIGFLVASWIVPVVLEQVGVIAPTWSLEDGMIALTSHVMELGGPNTASLLIGANIVTIIVFGLFASALATSRRDATRASEIQAWRLSQMVNAPRA